MTNDKRIVKVLLVTYHGGAGGVSVVVKNIAECLAREEDVEVSVCYASFEGIIGREVKEFGIPVYNLGMKGGLDVFNAIKIIPLIRKNKFDVIHLHYFIPLLRVLIAACRTKLVVITEHGSIKGEKLRKRWYIMKFIHRFLKNTADVYTGVSDDSKRDLIDNGLVGNHKVVRIYNGIDLQRYRKKEGILDLRQKLGLSNDAILIGTVRGLTPKMGLDHMIKAARLVNSKHENIHFVIVGDGILRSQLDTLSRELNVENNVHFLGERRDIHTLLQNFDIFVMPSVWETFGIAALEALACGVPVVAYAVGGLKEIVSDNINGLLIQERNPELLASALSSLIENPERRGTMALNAETSAQMFDRNRIALMYKSIYVNDRKRNENEA